MATANAEIEVSVSVIDATPAATVARLDEYLGAWAIESTRGLGMFDMIQKMNLGQHIQTTEKPRPSTREMVKALEIRAMEDDSLDDMLGTDEDSEDIDAEQLAAGGQVVTVAVVTICGTLMKQASSFDDSTSLVMLKRRIREVAADPQYAGIILKIDSPGGTVAGTPEAAQAIAEAATVKPVLAFCEDLTASAAYWLASQADEIYANHGTCEVGSIGVFIGTYDYSEASAKAGIKAKVYATGKLKGTGFPGTEITADQDEYLQGIVDHTQTYFVAAVAAGREVSPATVTDGWTTGGVFPADKAADMGLIDGIKTWENCLARMGELIAQRSGEMGRGIPAELKGAQTMSTTSTSAAPPTGTAAAPVIDPRAEMKTFVSAFGPKGAEYYADGKTFAEAQVEYRRATEAQLAQLEAENVKLTALVTQLRGEAKPVTADIPAVAGDPSKPAAKDTKSLAGKVGANIAAAANLFKTAQATK